MINIKINGENKKIPTMDQLTVKQYMKFVKTKMNLISYLSICLNMNYKEAFNIKLKNVGYLNQRIGQLKDYTKVPAPKKLIINDKLYFIKNIEISTVGQRFTIEENARKLKDEELFCFILAVGIVKDPMNIDDVKIMKNKIMNEPYINVLPLGFFLAIRFLNGRRKGMNFLRTLRQSIGMNT